MPTSLFPVSALLLGGYWLNPAESQTAFDSFYRVTLWNTGYKVGWKRVESRSGGTKNNLHKKNWDEKTAPLPSRQAMSYIVT